MFDEPHFEWHNTVNVDFSCEEAEVVGGRGFPHSPAGSRFRGRLCQVASPSVSTPFPGKQEDKSQGEPVMPAHIWWPRLIQMAASSCKGLWNEETGYQADASSNSCVFWRGACSSVAVPRSWQWGRWQCSLPPREFAMLTSPNQTGREKSVQPSSYFPKMYFSPALPWQGHLDLLLPRSLLCCFVFFNVI